MKKRSFPEIREKTLSNFHLTYTLYIGESTLKVKTLLPPLDARSIVLNLIALIRSAIGLNQV